MMPTATHPFSGSEIMAYLDGEMPPERAVAAALHIEQCRECQQLVEDLQSVSRRMLDWEIEPSAGAPPVLADEEKKERFVQWDRPWLRLAGAAVLLLLIVAIPLHWGWSLKRNKVIRQYVANQLVAPKGFMSSEGGGGAIGGVLGGVAGAPSPPANAPSPASAGPLIVRTAQLTLTSRNFDRSRADLDRIIRAHQGYIAQLAFNTPEGAGRSLNAALRVPAGQLDPVLDELKRLGPVREESQSGEDVTQHSIDVDARLSNLRTTEGRLLQILSQRAGRLSDVLQVEEAVDRTRGEIEVAEAEQKMLSNQVALATVQLSVSEEYKAPLTGNDRSIPVRLRNAAVEGCRNVVDGAISVLAFLLANGPLLLIVLALAFVPGRWLWRKWREARWPLAG